MSHKAARDFLEERLPSFGSWWSLFSTVSVSADGYSEGGLIVGCLDYATVVF